LGANGAGITLRGGELLTRNILAAAANTTATYTGLVFGNRGLAVGEVSGNNPGVVVLANLANSYTGGTLVQGGATLSVANDTNLGDPTGGIILATGELLTTASGFSTARAVDVSPTAGRNILAAANGTTATYTGVLSDGGTLVVGDGTHAGTVLLAGTNTYSGGTVIDLGTLIVDNAQALGTGNVTVNGGVLAADPQPINVLGDYTQNAGGTLQLNVAGRAIGQFDVLNVTGNAALNGTLRLINQGYQPQSGDKLRLVTTGGAVSGRFAQFQNPFALAVGFNTIDLVCVMTSTKSHPRV
jgi:autotransporter-associated beta strand protein